MPFPSQNFQPLILSVLAIAIVATSGCGAPPPATFKLNAVELLKQERFSLGTDDSFGPQYRTEIGTILTAIFGTPDQPRLPAILPQDDPALEVMTQENIVRAAGPAWLGARFDNASGQTIKSAGLYRAHCSHCHGITGDGAGPTAPVLNPYPRDFRLGKFKFKSTPLRSVPTDDDLMSVLVEGIPGTAMPSFRTLPQEDLHALVDYVKYLTIRGQYERYLIAELSSLETGEPLIDLTAVATESPSVQPNPPTSDEAEDEDDPAREAFLDSMFTLIGEALVEDVVGRWPESADNETVVPPAPAEMLIDHPNHADLVSQGRTLFFTRGNCAQCHGDTAVGNGQTENFDDWTNDWIKSPGVDPFDPATYVEFTQAGALPPRPVRPRNLTENIYRGGGHPNDLYLRISNGIEGTPMPAAATLNSDEIWALVAYVKALPYAGHRSMPWQHKPVNEKNIAQ